MKKTLILLAGYPGTGKSFLADLIIKRFPQIQLLSPDQIKENNWDEFGFNTVEEKERLIDLSWVEYYTELRKFFSAQVSVMSDYPFSEKQKQTLEKLTNCFGYQVITIRLVADLEVLFERQKARDLDSSRHLGHILKRYSIGMEVERNQAENLLDYSEFILRCTTRGYGTFSLGTLYQIDVTDYSKVDYNQLLSALEKELK